MGERKQDRHPPMDFGRFDMVFMVDAVDQPNQGNACGVVP
jgi:hypothetical protein